MTKTHLNYIYFFNIVIDINFLFIYLAMLFIILKHIFLFFFKNNDSILHKLKNAII